MENISGEAKLVHPLGEAKEGFGRKHIAFVVIASIFFGVFSAFVTANIFTAKKEVVPVDSQGKVDAKKIKKGAVFGSPDEKVFKDVAEGRLERGGIDGEGTHHLLRPGGESQTVYLTSSVIDLDQFVGRRVKVWGQTFAAQKAGWLMDVGRVEILE